MADIDAGWAVGNFSSVQRKFTGIMRQKAYVPSGSEICLPRIKFFTIDSVL